MSRPEAVPPKPTVVRNGRPASSTRRRPVELRYCSRHGTVEFGLYGQKQPRWTCKRCIAEAVTRRHQRVRRELVEEAGGRCAVCGYRRCAYNLHFHHVDPASKRFSMNMAAGKSIATYRAEARKCVLVCANCHGEIETRTIRSPPPGARFGEDWHSIAFPETIDDSRRPTAAEQLALELPVDDAEPG